MIRLSRIESNYQVVSVLPHAEGRAIDPIELIDLQLPHDVDLKQPVILFGPVPTWVYGRLVALCREAPWVGCFSAPEAEAVVIQSRVANVAVGDVIAIPLGREKLAPAVLVVGPPDSGKSVLSNALRRSLLAHYPHSSIFLHRANWDGEGNWSHEGQDHALIQRLVRNHERRIHERPSATELMAAFFAYHEAAVMNLRRVVDLVIVDVGGKVQPEKAGVRDRCTHGVIISRAPELVGEWRRFCEPTLELLTVIHSVLEERCEVKSRVPLEVIAGPWFRGKTHQVPEVVWQAVGKLL
ncbi:hypothetical protein BST81_18780 [Leptolyngbya sp. 'hensonii']|uniref:CRISPR-associated protein Csx3 n=1 Tax=Leptolyngbya sp. 'hensonii' TaxID=1922337 RepID=UPI00094FB15A|nr:CRISPR-associated protein Csx3 [Leptolyngbya sp. 'hensonii']OLP17021.1 hypothetical protein BST81_18780 [Leptolyngbya sp. 'hensonii']